MLAGRTILETLLIALQALIFLFLLMHDWIPMGRLNNRAAKRRQDPLFQLLWTTFLAAIPAAVCLVSSARYFGRQYPMWLEMWLWITYGVFLFGLLRSWWIPYLLVPDERRAARYQSIFENTHAFLPMRNGIVPDTLHTIFHLCVFAVVIILAIREFTF